MRSLFALVAAASVLVACSSTSNEHDSDDPLWATEPTVDSSYADLFDAQAEVAEKDVLDGLWQLKSGPCGSELRAQFADGQMRFGVKWGEALFGLTAEYEISEVDPDGITAIDLVFAKDVETVASDGMAEGDAMATTFNIGVTAGPAEARNESYGSSSTPSDIPLAKRSIAIGGLIDYSCTEYGSGGHGDGGGGKIQGGFRKIAD